MISLLEIEFVSRRKWLERDEFLDMAAIAESTPGPIAINAATYIGYRQAGVMGSIASTIAICIPSFAIIYVISLFFDAFLYLKYVQYAFKGIQVCVIYLIMSAGFKMLKGIKKNAFDITIIVATIAFMVLFSVLSVNFSTIFYILICGAVGVVVYLCRFLKRNGTEEEKKDDIS